MIDARKEITELAEDFEFEVVFLDPAKTFDPAIVGLTQDGRVAYERAKIVEMMSREMTHEEADEWVSFNTERALPYMGDHAPILLNYVTQPLPLDVRRKRG